MTTLFGRDQELAAARAAIAHRAGVVLTGAAGAGTTSIGRALVDECSLAGLPSWRVSTLGAPSDLLRPESVPEPDAATSGPAGSVRRMLGDGGEPTIVHVDDVDRLADATAAELLDAAHDGLARLVLSARTGASLPEPVTRALRSGGLVRVECGPLDAAATAALAEHVAGGPLTQPAHHLIASTAIGLPLHIREIVLAARESDVLSPVASAWSLREIPAAAPRLATLLEHRLAGLTDAERDAFIRVAAVEPAGLWELEPDVAEETLESLRRLGMVRIGQDRRRMLVSIASPLYASVARATTSPLDLRAIRTTVAERLSTFDLRRRADRERCAVWSLAGVCDVEVDALAEASRSRFAEGDIGLAERLARAAFERQPTFATGRVLEPPLYELADREQLEAHYERWGALASTAEERAVVAQSVASGRFWRERDGEAPSQLLARAVEFDGDLRDEVVAQAASLLVSQGRVAEAAALGEPLLHATPGKAQVHATLAVGHGWRAAGRPESAVAVLDTVMAAYRAAGPDAFVVPFSVLNSAQTHALVEAGRFADADRSAAEGVRAGEESRSPTAIGLANLARGWSAVLRGRAADAERWTGHAAGWLTEARHPGMVRWALLARALGRLQAGDLTGGIEVRRELDRIGEHPARIFESNLDRVDAWIAFLEGRSPDSFDHLRAGADRALDCGDTAAALACWHDLARLGRPAEAVERLAAIDTAALEGPYLDALVRHIQALANDDVDDLGRCCELLAERGLDNLAAECADAAAAWCMRRNDHRGASTWLRRAGELRSELGADGRLEPDLTAIGLTRREAEIAPNAARGLSSREIGERLGISTRTVENHLARIYQKLGVGNRVELARRLAGDDPSAS